MTPAETWIAIRGYNERKNDEFKAEWERTRWLGTLTVNMWAKKKVSPTTLLPFPWEKEGPASQADVETLRKEMGWQQPEQIYQQD